MPAICAIFSHIDGNERALTCLSRLAQQTRRPEYIVIENHGPADSPTITTARQQAAAAFPGGGVHILQGAPQDAGNCTQAMQYAFDSLGADFVWLLTAAAWPRPHTLANLLAAEVDNTVVRISVVIDPARADELSRPIAIADNEPDRWKSIVQRADLPAGELHPCRGSWLGALIPREAWQKAGQPTGELFEHGENAEYSWKLKAAGFSFATVMNAELEHPAAPRPLLRYHIAHRSFIYEPGLPIPRQYYKNRNWAWIRRLRAPHRHLRRLIACGLYIGLSLISMLRTRELSIERVYNLFRALHNGFYGKLRPY